MPGFASSKPLGRRSLFPFVSSSLSLRIATAALLAPLWLLVIFYAGSIVFFLLIAGVLCLAAWEWALLSGFVAKAGRLLYAGLPGLGLLGGFLYLDSAAVPVAILAVLLWWLFVLPLVVWAQRTGRNPLQARWLKALLGLLVLIPAGLSLLLLREQAAASLLAFLFILIWTADSSAYFAGKRWARRRLASKISPGKTWEGLAGALAASGSVVLLYALVDAMQVFEFSLFLLLCLVTVLASILGDLLESMMKRSVALQDSGCLLPGHGGVLDRIDSLTAAAPVFFAGLWALERF